jgi:hypothetical protein
MGKRERTAEGGGEKGRKEMKRGEEDRDRRKRDGRKGRKRDVDVKGNCVKEKK